MYLLTTIGCKNSSEPLNESTKPSYKIVYVSDREQNNQIYVMDMDGNNDTRLTYDSENYYFDCDIQQL